MREYKNRKNLQKQSYYLDRFYVTPNQEKKDVQSDEVFSKDLEIILETNSIQTAFIRHTHLVLNIKKCELIDLMQNLKNNLSYNVLIDLSAIDYIEEKDGFEVFYELLSMEKRKRLRVKTFIKKDETIESISSIFKSANWLEREMFDMFGIKLVGHPNLKRLLMPDDWYDYPLKKSYPLQGDESASWYEIDKIFGKSAREKIGPEQRDSATVDRYDSEVFARLGFDIPKGFDIENAQKSDKKIYQEDDAPFFMKKFKDEESKVLDKRK